MSPQVARIASPHGGWPARLEIIRHAVSVRWGCDNAMESWKMYFRRIPDQNLVATIRFTLASPFGFKLIGDDPAGVPVLFEMAHPAGPGEGIQHNRITLSGFGENGQEWS